MKFKKENIVYHFLTESLQVNDKYKHYFLVIWASSSLSMHSYKPGITIQILLLNIVKLLNVCGLIKCLPIYLVY